MRVKNHKIEGVPYRPAKLIGGTIVPEIVVLHDTAGRLDRGNSAAYLRTSPVHWKPQALAQILNAH